MANRDDDRPVFTTPLLGGGSTTLLGWEQLAREVVERENQRLFEPETEIEFVRLGKYEVRRKIGSGGMGVVYEGFDTVLRRRVAIKTWKLEGTQAAKALHHEARCLARLSHPNVVAVHETGGLGDPIYLVMEYVDGLDMTQWLAAAPRKWTDVLDRYIDAGRGLAAVHAAGLLHGDVKPDNVLVGHDGRVRVGDFGIACRLRESISDDGEPQAALGTWVYMPPERLLPRRFDDRADQFSFCVSLWQALYGVRPFDGKTPIAILASIEAGIPRVEKPLPGVPRRLRAILERGFSYWADDRFRDMPALLRALEDVPEQPRRWRRRAATAAAAMALGGVAVFEVGRALTGVEQASGEPLAALVEPEEPGPTVDRALKAATYGDPVDAWNALREIDEKQGIAVDELLAVASVLAARGQQETGPARGLSLGFADKAARWAWNKADRNGLIYQRDRAMRLIGDIDMLSSDNPPSRPR